MEKYEPPRIRDISLREARETLLVTREHGTHCPCCGQFAKVYKRKLNSSMAHALILMAKYFSRPDCDEWLHIPRYFMANRASDRDCAKLIYWGLIEARRDIVRDDGCKHVGYYRVTDLGFQFVRGLATVKKFAVIYDSELLALTGEEITIREALGERFNYDELMGADRC